MNSINERFVELVEFKTSPGKRFKELEDNTKIPAVSWRKAFIGGQRPTSEMLEALAKLWPEHAYWLITGGTDNEFSHISPKAESQLDTPYQSRPAGAEYLRLQVALSALYDSSTTQAFQDRFEEWLTEHQERGKKRWPWLYSVHPKLAAKKVEKARITEEQSQLIEDAIARLHIARSKRIAEFKVINENQEE